MCYISNLFRPITKHEEKYKFTKNEQLLVRRQYKGVRQLWSRRKQSNEPKYKEENIRSYLKRFNSLVALMPTLRAGFSLSMYKETPRNKAECSCCFCLWFECFFEKAELKWYQASMKEDSEFEKPEMFNRFIIWGKCSHSYSCLPTAVVLKSECQFNLNSRHLSFFPIYFALHSG